MLSASAPATFPTPSELKLVSGEARPASARHVGRSSNATPFHWPELDREEIMDLAFVPAVAAFGGSASGGLVAAISGWITQRRKDHSRRALRAVSHRQKLYKNFIEEASKLYAEALTNDEAEIPKLIGMYALIGRMKIVSSDEVNEAAERAARSIIQAYASPNKTFVELPDVLNEIDPLRAFSDACRRELQGQATALRI
jgi:hypothetical protein